MIDAEVAADADQPGLKVRAPIERVQRLEDLEEDVLRQILGLVVAADELVGEVEDLAPVLPDDLLPRDLIAARGSARSARRYSGPTRRAGPATWTCGIGARRTPRIIAKLASRQRGRLSDVRRSTMSGPVTGFSAAMAC